MANKIFQVPINLVNLASDPVSASEGDIYYNTTSDVVKVYANGSWVAVGSGGGSASDSFKTIAVTGQDSVVADSSTDTLNLVAGTNVSLTTNATTDSITINSTGNYTSVDSITYPDYITFDTTPETIPTATGSIYWDSGDGLPVTVLNANVSIGLGQEEVALVKNATGSSIAKGKVVYINGAQGQRPTIALSDADTEATSSKTFGITAETIANGAEGFVTTFGVLRGVNTNGLAEGSALWLSSTAGDYTTSIPAEPAHSVFIGYVVKAHASSGEIFVNIQNGYELNELHGVAIENNGNLTDNEVLAYDTTSGLWINQTSVEAGLIDTSATEQTKAGNLIITGNLTVNGTTTTINSTTLTVDDKNIELGSASSPTNITADGGGITLKGDTDKTFNWVNSTSAWTSSEHISLGTGKNLLLNGATSGTITVTPTAISGTNTITIPAATGTVALTSDITKSAVGLGNVENIAVKYQADAPTSPSVGDIWVESDIDVPTDTYATLTSIQTLTNKTLTSPILNSATFGGNIVGGSTLTAFGTTDNLTIGDSNGYTVDGTFTNNVLSGGNVSDSVSLLTLTDNYSVRNVVSTVNEVNHTINIGTGSITNNSNYATKNINIGTGTILYGGSTYITIGTTGSTTVLNGSVTIGSVVSTEISYLNGVTSAIQTQLNSKAPLASPTFTGTVQLGTSATFVVEGATDNAFETTLTVADPTADRTITFPNATGTVALVETTPKLVAKQTTAGSAIANTETVVLSFTAPANSISAGDVFRFTGFATRAGTTSTAPTFRIRIGTTTLTGAIVSTLAPTATVTVAPFKFEAIVTCRTAGSSGTIGGAASALYSTGVGGNSITAPVTVNTTVQNLVEATIISGTAGNSYTFEHAILEKLPS